MGKKDLTCLCWKGPWWGWKGSWVKLIGRGFEEEPVPVRGVRTGRAGMGGEALVVAQVQAGEKARGLHSRSCWAPGKQTATPTLGVLVLTDAGSLQLVRKDKMKLLTAWGLYTSTSLQRALPTCFLCQSKSWWLSPRFCCLVVIHQPPPVFSHRAIKDRNVANSIITLAHCQGFILTSLCETETGTRGEVDSFKPSHFVFQGTNLPGW